MKRIFFFQIILGLFILIALDSCIFNLLCINGNGIEETEEIISPDFTGVINTTQANVIFEKGDNFNISITADANILQYFKTSVSGSNLEIEVKGANCIRPVNKPVIYITAPQIKELAVLGSGDFIADSLSGSNIIITSTGSGNINIENAEGESIRTKISGSGNISINNLIADSYKAIISGSGDMNLSGISQSGLITSTGSGNLYAYDLISSICNILISGSGDVLTTVENEMIATLTGSGNLYYKGDPEIFMNVSGSGRIISTK